MAEIAPSAEALAFEIQQGVGSGNWGRAAISDAIKLYAAAAVAAERDQCVQEWIALNKCLGFLARCEGDEAARAWNSFAGLMDEWAARAAAVSLAATAAEAEIEDAMIATLDGVLRIGRQAEPIEPSRFAIAQQTFETARCGATGDKQ